MIERQIITGLIVSTEYIQQIFPIWDRKLLEAKTAQRIADWCIEYFEKYHKAPGRTIQSIYDAKLHSGQLPEDLAADVEEILIGLSDEFDESFNLQYVLDKTNSYFKERHLAIHTKKVQELLEADDVDAANALASTYRGLSFEISNDLDLSNPSALLKVENAFMELSTPLITYPGALGELWNSQLTRGSLIGILAPEKRGKCLPGDQKILTSTGQWVELKQLIKEKRTDIVSWDESEEKFVKTQITDFWKNGNKPVYRVTTRSGRAVTVTKNHPFLTPDGWLDLNQIGVGDSIAVPKRLPIFGKVKMEDHVVRLLAYFIAEGCLREYSYKIGQSTKVICFTNADKDIKRDFTKCVALMDCSVTWHGIDGRVRNSKENKRKHNKNYVLDLVKKYDLWNKLSYDKTIPDSIFQTTKKNTALFLSILYTCDGWSNRDGSQVGFTVANEELARQVHTLLTKFGIVSRLNWGYNSKAGFWSVLISGNENIRKFQKEISFQFTKQEKFTKGIRGKKRVFKSFLDKFPTSIAQAFHDELKDEFSNGKTEYTQYGYPLEFNRLFKKASSVREQIAKKQPIMRQSFAEVRHTETGKKYFNSDLLWDQIVSVTYLGEQETYDLTVSTHHNFIAENIIVHNTFLLLDMCVRAVRNKAKVAFFQAGDMTENQQIKRIASYLAKKPVQEKYCGDVFFPVIDCVRNQLDTCDKEERECDFGPFADYNKFDERTLRKEISMPLLKEAFALDGEDYRTCRNCKDFQLKFLGTPWIQKTHIKSPIHVNEAKRKVQEFYIDKKRRLRMSTHANGTLSIGKIDQILDRWEREDGFVADVIAIDYADILIDDGGHKEERHRQNQIWKDARGLSQTRNCLVLFPSQADANSYETNILKLSNYSEDKRKYGHCTGFFGLNQDKDGREKKIGLLRINELLAREGRFDATSTVTVLQNLDQGRPFIGSYK